MKLSLIELDDTDFLKRVPDKLSHLGFFESLCDEELMHNNLLLTTSLVISVNNKFCLNHEILHKTVCLWVKNHPFLQATILRDVDRNTGKSKLKLPKHFIKMDKDVDDYGNLEYIQNLDNLISWQNSRKRAKESF